MSTYRLKISIPECLDRIIVAPLMLLRRLWYGYQFRRISLVNSKMYAIVDAEDFHELSQYTWLAKKTPRSYVAVRFEAKGRLLIPVYMHRQIMEAELNAKRSTLNAELFVDHKNRNSIDNRRPNLRLATQSQNCMNRQKQKVTSSKYKGVSWIRSSGKWKAAIHVDKKALHLGYFESEEEAARAYDAAARKYQDEFAYQNFPAEGKEKGLRNVLRGAYCVLRKRVLRERIDSCLRRNDKTYQNPRRE